MSFPSRAAPAPQAQQRQVPPSTADRSPAGNSASTFLNNGEAARYLNLSPRTLEKHRVIGGGPRFRKFGRRVVYAISDLEAWANARVCESTSDPEYTALR